MLERLGFWIYTKNIIHYKIATHGLVNSELSKEVQLTLFFPQKNYCEINLLYVIIFKNSLNDRCLQDIKFNFLLKIQFTYYYIKFKPSLVSITYTPILYTVKYYFSLFLTLFLSFLFSFGFKSSSLPSCEGFFILHFG